MQERYAFFAPIWRVMRDANMSVDEVKEQVAYVALVTKQASQISDLRSHEYLAPRLNAPVVYFRGLTPGVCTYFDDRKGAVVPFPHGACWYERCNDLRVIDVPGDHFSLLRQDLEDMNVLITGLKLALGPYGWTETVRYEGKPQYAVSSEEIQDIDSYLQKMGVNDPSLRQRLEASMPFTTEDGVGSAHAAARAKTHAPVAAGNTAAKEALSDAEPNLIVCCDANGLLGGLDGVFSALDMPVFVVRLPHDGAIWDAADLVELARVAVKSVQRAVPAGGALVLAGVGFGALLAHEMALQLDAENDRVAALALFEGAYTLANTEVTLNWLSVEQQREACQVASTVYPEIREAAGAAAPSFDAFVSRLASIAGFEGQLDYITSFRPYSEEQAAWDKRIDELLARLSYFKTVAETYAPMDIFPGQTLVFLNQGSTSSEQPEADSVRIDGPGGVWEPIRFLIQPASVHQLRPTWSSQAATSSTSAVLSTQLRAAVLRRNEAEERATGPSALALMSPREPAPKLSGLTEPAGASICAIAPLNRLCPERRYILRRAGRPGTTRQLPAGPLCRIPLWILHAERGDVSSAQKELATALPLPCYGLAMGADADQCSSLEELAGSYCAAMIEMQPAGPYLLLGTSVVGAAIAHNMAMQLRAVGRTVALIILDGCLGSPSIPLHDSTWYALFYLLREIGSLRGGMGEFVDFVRGAGSPTQQLKLIASYRPLDPSVPREAWDAAVYATLDRAATLKRMLRARGVYSSLQFDGPAAIVVPRDRLGMAFVDASRSLLHGGQGEDEKLVHVPIDARHTECLLSQVGRSAAATGVTKAVQALLQQIG